MLDKNTIQTLNKDPGSIDLHELALAKMKNAKVAVGARHDMIADRMRDKTVGTYDEAYKKYNELRKNGFLDLFNSQNKVQTPKGAMMKESSIGRVPEVLLEMVSVGSPIAPMGGSSFTVEQQSPLDSKKVLTPKLPSVQESFEVRYKGK